MPKIKLLRINSIADSDYGYQNLLEGITDWEEVTEEELALIRKGIELANSGQYYSNRNPLIDIATTFRNLQVIVQVDKAKEFVLPLAITLVREYQEKKAAEEQARKKKAEESAAKREVKKLREKRKLLEELKAELGEK